MKNRKLIKSLSIVFLIASLFLLVKNLPNSTMSMMSAGTFMNFIDSQPGVLVNIVLYGVLSLVFIGVLFKMGDK
jgi:uncharacterized membrane-anchored protein YitT (DUF2179 family)